jgi:hypothetical protein
MQVPETLQYRVVRAMSRHDLTVLAMMAEAPGILQAKPRFAGKQLKHDLCFMHRDLHYLHWRQQSFRDVTFQLNRPCQYWLWLG